MDRCIFHDVGPGQHERCVFEIVERAYNDHKRVLIFARDEERAAALDRTLWVLKQEAFIPHKIFSHGQPDSPVPVAIAISEINPVEATILIADGHCSLEFACSFESVHEFVDRSSPEIHEACRERFRAYRARQISVEHLRA